MPGPGRMCLTPLDAAAQERAASSVALIWWVIGKWYQSWCSQHGDDLYSEGALALCIAARNYDPSQARWSTFATTSVRRRIWNYTRRQVPLACAAPLKNSEDFELSLADRGNWRPVPTANNWTCDNCSKEINWHPVSSVHNPPSKKRGLCNSCAEAARRARKKGWGEGVCARCARVMWAKRVKSELGHMGGSRYAPTCSCAPGFRPSYTLVDAAEKPHYVLGSERPQ